MKTLIIYYSRDGHTKKVAEQLKEKLMADCFELQEVQSRLGIVGWLKAGKDATLKKITEIIEPNLDLPNYDLVIIGTPVWAFTMASAVRGWLDKYGKQLPLIAFFVTMSRSGDKRTFQHMEELCGKEPIATAAFIDKKIDLDTPEYNLVLDEFITKLIGSIDSSLP